MGGDTNGADGPTAGSQRGAAGSDRAMAGSASQPCLIHGGGTFGAVAPLLLFHLVGAGWLGLSGAPDERGFWPVLVAAHLLSLALVVDRTRWAETVVDGMADRFVSLMILAWMVSGTLPRPSWRAPWSRPRPARASAPS